MERLRLRAEWRVRAQIVRSAARRRRRSRVVDFDQGVVGKVVHCAVGWMVDRVVEVAQIGSGLPKNGL